MYDYIIVGAGSAGCVLASRLTEDPETSVLLFEADSNDDIPEIHNPADAPKLFQSAVDWGYSTEEEPYLNNRKIYWPRGKVLGGSSSTNFMVYAHGNRYDYVPCLFPPPITGDGYTFAIVPLSPQSRGHLTLRSTDPTQPPAIFANYLAHQADLQTYIKGMKLARSLAQAKAFAPFYEAEREPSRYIQNDQEIVEFIRNNIQTTFHPVGTCKMGHDNQAVVDDQLRVHGVEGLRVVDASIMPTLVNGNTNGPVIMIAEKIAALLTNNVQ